MVRLWWWMFVCNNSFKVVSSTSLRSAGLAESSRAPPIGHSRRPTPKKTKLCNTLSNTFEDRAPRVHILGEREMMERKKNTDRPDWWFKLYPIDVDLVDTGLDLVCRTNHFDDSFQAGRLLDDGQTFHQTGRDDDHRGRGAVHPQAQAQQHDLLGTTSISLRWPLMFFYFWNRISI